MFFEVHCLILFCVFFMCVLVRDAGLLLAMKIIKLKKIIDL